MDAPNKIKLTDFPQDQYIAEETQKKIIVIHHTCGGTAESSIEGWKQDKPRIATHIVIDRNGQMFQQYSSKYWAYHLGLDNKIFHEHNIPYQSIDKISLSIELASYGEVTKHADGNWYNEYNGKIKGEVVTYNTPFRGIKSFEKYTTAQIESLKQILLYWGWKFNIPLNYNEAIWNIDEDALRGKPGIYMHVSYRKDKSDCHPQSELITMLKSLV